LLADALHSFPTTKIMKEIKKVTTSERSASQIYRSTEGSGAESKDPEDGCCPMLSGAFRPQNLKEIKKVTASDRSGGTFCSAVGANNPGYPPAPLPLA
jgi:hypothetical protein